MVLIGELVKTLNLYSNPGVGNHSNVNTNSNACSAFKRFWMQKTRSNWVFLTWSLCFIAFLFETIVICSLVFVFFLLFLGCALHNIHAFHSRCFYFWNKKKLNFFLKKKGRRKRKQIVFLHYSLCFWKQGWSIYFHMTCLLYFV